MATQLFLTDAIADTHLGTDNLNLLSAAVGWTSRALSTSRGSGVVASDNVATVTGPTAGITVTKGSIALEWISPPIAADVTISGSPTYNIWVSESNMSANVAINFVVEVIRANATGTRNSNTIAQLDQTTQVAEAAVTTRAVTSYVEGLTSTVINRGDRLRIRVFADDAIGNLATGFTFNIGYNGATAAADGDTYVTFTENITFESAPSLVLDQTTNGTLQNIGTTTLPMLAQSFVAQTTELNEVRVYLFKSGTPTDDVVLEIQTDSSGSPSGSVVGTVATVNNASLTTTSTQYTYSCSIALTQGVTYWLVYRRSGAANSSNYYLTRVAGSDVSGWSTYKRHDGSSWILVSGPLVIRLQFLDTRTTLYLTNTASDVATASVDREAWTSRGAGVQTDVRNTAAGWTAPLQLTDTAGGTVVDWFTKRLTAFTLTGMAVANIRALESNALANASLRCEIARVENDGTSPTVWASWCIAPITTDNAELGTTEAARTCNISGDDLAISDGQRLRLRIYAEDISSAAMAASQTVTVYYAGTSGGASGDTYITLPVTVTEYTPPAAGGLLPRRRRPAHRYTTVR